MIVAQTAHSDATRVGVSDSYMHIIHVSIALCAQGKVTLQLATLPCKDDDCFDVSVNDPKR